MKLLQRAVCALALLCLALTSSHAQFVDQRTWGGTATGTNAIAITVPNWTASLAGVPLRFLPANDNTGATTINVSGVGAVNVLKPNNAALTALVGGEIRAGQLTTVVYDGTQYVLQGQLGPFTAASTLANSALGFIPINLQLNASVGANALTIAMQTAAGANPTATTPIFIPFRDVTIANGDPVIRSITGALSFTIGSTNTMGCTSAVACRLWIVAIDNGGTVALCAYNASSAGQVFPINEGALQTSASGTSGGSSLATYYCSVSAVTSKAIRILGYLDITESTAGTWASGPTFTQLFGPGIKKPGDTVQEVATFVGAEASGSGGFTLNNTIPTNTAGDQYMSLAITPSATVNILDVDTQGLFSNNAGSRQFVGLYQDAVTNALSAALNVPAGVTSAFQMHIRYRQQAQIAGGTATTFKVRSGSATSNVTTFNGENTNPWFGGVMNSYIIIREIMGALEPANDNTELRMVG